MYLTETQSRMKCIILIQIKYQPQISLTFPYRNEQNFSYITFANATISHRIYQHYAIQFLSTKLNKFSQINQCSTKSFANMEHTKLQSNSVFSSLQTTSSQWHPRSVVVTIRTQMNQVLKRSMHEAHNFTTVSHSKGSKSTLQHVDIK